MPLTQFPLTPVHVSSAAPVAIVDASAIAAAVATRVLAGAAALALPADGATQVAPSGRGSPSHATCAHWQAIREHAA